MTLGDGIRELRTAEGADSDAGENVAPDLVPDIDIHDSIHVLFACPTNLAGEISAHLWTIFGTTVRLREMRRVNMHQDHRQVLADIGHAKLVKTWFKNIPHLIATFYCSMRMTRKWPASDYSDYLDVPLDELRKEFNICLPNRRGTSVSRGRAGAGLRHVRDFNSWVSTHDNL
ncbi:MAG: hypothetical protein O3C60_13550 [Planctomycetota bacterium]|nr:hypothetical protein [Planctomycetota bacterium]